MALLVPDVGEERLLGWAINSVAQQNLELKLYLNNYTPVEGSTHENFTVLPLTEGLAVKTLTAGSWTVDTDGAGTTSATYVPGTPQSWTFTGSAHIIYGYVVVDANDGVLIWAERFASAEATYDGKIIKLIPYIELA